MKAIHTWHKVSFELSSFQAETISKAIKIFNKLAKNNLVYEMS